MQLSTTPPFTLESLYPGQIDPAGLLLSLPFLGHSLLQVFGGPGATLSKVSFAHSSIRDHDGSDISGATFLLMTEDIGEERLVTLWYDNGHYHTVLAIGTRTDDNVHLTKRLLSFQERPADQEILDLFRRQYLAPAAG